MLGHENSRTTDIYAKLMTNTVKNEVLGAFNKINDGKK